ncbi:MAG TPA: hemerythrin domain-containing protein [Polyangiaceae bacterium]|nr:hemerythrin domain-containing protein [Polyangiaceae bacterium]
MPNPIENAMAKGAGKVAAVEARAKGLKGVFTKLAEQHREAATLLARADSTNDLEKRRDLWNEIKRQLISHERAELAEIYPVLASYDATREIARLHDAEAATLESTIKQLDAMTFETPAWKTTLEKLIGLVKAHAAQEESEFFPRAQQTIGDDASRQLEDLFLEAQKRAMSELR